MTIGSLADGMCWRGLDVSCFCKLLEPVLHGCMLLVVDVVHFAGAKMDVARVQGCATVGTYAATSVGTKFVRILPLWLSEELLCEVDKVVVGDA